MINGTIQNTPVRSIKGKVVLYNGSTLADTFNHDGDLKEFKIERVGDNSKFFGFGISQKANVKVRDVSGSKNITTANTLKPYLNNLTSFPTFKVSEVHRDENTNELSITAYDALYQASAHTVSEVALTSYSVLDFIYACAEVLGIYSVVISENVDDYACFDTYYENGANFEGTETIREALDAAAEATQCIYYLNASDELVFKRLDKDGEAALDITKSDYITLSSKTNRKLTHLVSATELGDNLEVSTTEIGSTQYIRDNPFWDLREDRATLLENALAAVGGLLINQFECSWRGNYLLEIGDKIGLTTKDNKVVYSYVLDDLVEYSGAYSQTTQWSYSENESESAATPTNVGDVIKQTFAKVDKVNKQIDIVVSESQANSEAIAAIGLNTQGISATVSEMKQNTTTQIDALGDEVATLTNKVAATMTPENVQILIENEMAGGMDKVTTRTGYTFDEMGLTISKTDSEMETQITEDGMTVAKNDETVLVADNQGVKAANLHATTYLIIGTNSRFEDYINNDGEARTGCFWIG